MTIQIVSPRVGWCREATIKHWLVDDGEWVVAGQPICLLKTEHSLVPILALQDGFFRARRPMLPAGTRLTWQTPIGSLLVPGAKTPATPRRSPPVPSRVPCRVEAPSLPEDKRPPRPGRGPRMSPRARRLARSKGLDITSLVGTGRGGRVRERDVQTALPKVGSQEGTGFLSGLAASRPLMTGTVAPVLAGQYQFEGTFDLLRAESPPNPPAIEASRASDAPSSHSPRPLGSAGLDRLIWAVFRTLRRHPLHLASNRSRSNLPMSVQVVYGWPEDVDSVIEPLVEEGLREMFVAFPSGESEPSLSEIQRQLQSQRDPAGGERVRRAEFSIIDLAEWSVESCLPPIPAKTVAALSVGAPKLQAIPVDGKLLLRSTRRLVLATDAARVDFVPSLRFFRALMLALQERPTSTPSLPPATTITTPTSPLT